jgi:hypothetical protein
VKKMADEDVAVSQVNDESEYDDAFAEFAQDRDTDDDPQELELEPEGEGHRAQAGDEPLVTAPDPDQEEEDAYAGMTPEVKAKFVALEDNTKSLQHTIDSDAGRVSAFQRKINNLERQQQAAPRAQPSSSQIADAMKGSDAQWDQFKEDYPEVAQALDNRFAAMGVAAQDSIDQTLAPVKEHQAHIAQVDASNAHKARIDKVAEVYPTWTAEVKKPEFNSWLSTQPPGVQALSESDDTEDASTLIGLYDGHLVAEGQPTLKADPGSTSVNEVPADTTRANTRRQQQLEAGTTVPSKPARVDGTAEAGSEFEDAFAVFAKRKEAQQRQTA